MKNFNLKKKNIFVIGGSGLIGYEVSKLLNFNGAKVLILDEKEISKNKINFCKFEITTNLFQNQNDLERVFKIYGVPDGMINCSYPKNKNWKKSSFSKISYKNFDENIDLHLKSYVWLAKIFAEKMKSKKINGKIVQLSSIYGILGQDLSIYKKTDMSENMMYPLIKGGISSFTKQMASYYGKYNITINNLCPGGVLESRKGKKKQNKNFLKNYSNKVPLCRLANSGEIASVAAFLLSNYSDYITGQDIIVDGGWSII